jgi:FkbM family methyltransferase
MYKLLRFFGHLNWVRYGIRYRVIQLFVPIGKVNKEIEVDFFGLKYCGNLIYSIDWIVYFFGAYEQRQLLWVKNILLKRGNTNTALDIGANVGNHTLFFSTFFKNVHSFEPYPPIYEKLNKNTTINHLSNVTLHQVALSNTNGNFPFYYPDSSNIGTGTLNKNRTGNPNAAININIYDGDDYCKEHNITQIDFVKIDVEGHELEVLLGLEGLIRSNKPIIWFEFTPKDNLDNKLKIFNKILDGFHFYRLDTLKEITDGQINELQEELDILATPYPL